MHQATVSGHYVESTSCACCWSSARERGILVLQRRRARHIHDARLCRVVPGHDEHPEMAPPALLVRGEEGVVRHVLLWPDRLSWLWWRLFRLRAPVPASTPTLAPPSDPPQPPHRTGSAEKRGGKQQETVARGGTDRWVVRRRAGLMLATRLHRVGLAEPLWKAAPPLTHPQHDRCEDDKRGPLVCGQARTVSGTAEPPPKLEARLAVPDWIWARRVL